MKKKFLYVALFALTLASCSDQEIIEQPSTPTGGTEVQLPADVTSGELLIKFKPEMTDILDQTMTRATRSGGAMTRSGIPSTDEVLEILGGYHFERIFPVDQQNEERTRAAGLHLWYLVKFDENTDLQEKPQISEEAQEAMVYGICAGLCINDEPELYSTYMQRYNGLIDSMITRKNNMVRATVVGGIRM